MDKVQMDLAKIIESYFGADAGYLDIDCFTLARRIMEAGWTKPVRCKDCKHRYTASSGVIFCTQHLTMSANDNDFCSYGERRSDGPA